MDSAALRELVRDYQLGLRDDIKELEAYFLHKWYFIDGDGYELTQLKFNKFQEHIESDNFFPC
ncbi:hypothetical protein SAMN00777080_3463 [Aquiflexum balticum DSM 16537]|uniref:Uncharacterized protein n=1 Tax=Aquiflexum balticum DSM 16537 TaxID=758820 RepID=A0A1W2H7I8_9BACT|nr:hypothetical protein [Aquiflexum balticum]SMD44829.1 hypothetical protein SAMN00777080_3463 [Aquiflexum balticum DSM 16537]